MKNISIAFSMIIAIICVALLLLLSKKCGNPDPFTVHKSDTVFIHDTVFKEVPVKVPVPYAVNCKPDTFWKNQDIDTMAIIESYFCEKFYNDTITDDSTFQAVLKETISHNEIIYRNFQHKNLVPTTIINNTTVVNNLGKWYVGPYINIAQKSGIGAQLIYVQNRKFLVTGNIDILNKTAGIGYIFKIK